MIFVNDGSTDGSGALLDRFRAEDPRVRVIDHDRNHGLTAALDCGFRHARGAAIAMLDADLQNPPAELARLYALAARGRHGHRLAQGPPRPLVEAHLLEDRQRLPQLAD